MRTREVDGTGRRWEIEEKVNDSASDDDGQELGVGCPLCDAKTPSAALIHAYCVARKNEGALDRLPAAIKRKCCVFLFRCGSKCAHQKRKYPVDHHTGATERQNVITNPSAGRYSRQNDRSGCAARLPTVRVQPAIGFLVTHKRIPLQNLK